MVGKVLVLLALLVGRAAWADPVLERAERALMRLPAQGDEAFLIGQGRQLRGLGPLFLRPDGDYIRRRDEFPFSLEYALWALRDKPVTLRQPVVALVPLTLSDPARARRLRSAGSNYLAPYVQQAREVVRVMRLALECKPAIRPPSFGPAGYEYVSTHQVGAAVLARHRGCLGGEAFRQVVSPYLSRVHGEYLATRSDPLSDLQVERMAMLCFAGHCRAVLPEDILRLRRAQGGDGLWRLPDNVKEIAGNPAHASALAYFVLAAHAVAR